MAVTGPSGVGQDHPAPAHQRRRGCRRRDASSSPAASCSTIDIDLGNDQATGRRRCPKALALLDDRKVGTNVALGLPAPGAQPAHAGRPEWPRCSISSDCRPRWPIVDRAELSVSERQRVALARALVGGPALLLLDEPFYAFDPADPRAPPRRACGRVLAAAGTATVLVSHHDSDVAELADRRWRLHDGRLVPPPA